ncbi:MAG: phosphatidate cytidylyltransferase, partial [Candidatus Coatesbacteria bacterium]
ILAVIATIVEGITPYGFDNLTVPILTSFIYYFVFI